MARTPLVVFGVAVALGLGTASGPVSAAPLTGSDVSVGIADHGSVRNPGDLRSAVRRASRQAAIADADHDGMVTLEEAMAFHAARFAAMDRDRDGALSELEFLDEGASTASEWAINFRTGPPTEFEVMDLDGDGILSREEFLRAGLEHKQAARPDRIPERQRIFSILDAKGNGSVSREAYMAAAARYFARMDEQGAGALTLWEFLTRLRF